MDKDFKPYTANEILLAAIQIGGPMIWATGPYHPEQARRKANDWKLVADAMEREWVKELPNDR